MGFISSRDALRRHLVTLLGLPTSATAERLVQTPPNCGRTGNPTICLVELLNRKFANLLQIEDVGL